MGVIKLKSVRDTKGLGNLKDYLERDGRNVKSSTLNVDRPTEWVQEFKDVKETHQKTSGVQYYTLIQSFENEEDKEKYNVDDVHRMGVELAQVFADKGYQVAIETHSDTDNLHNHIVINSVNQYDGKKLRISRSKVRYDKYKADLYMEDLKTLNDEICKQNGLHTLTESKELKDQQEKDQGIQPISKATDEIYVKDSYKERMRKSLQDIWEDTSITNAEDFNRALEKEGICISRRTGTGNITYEDKEGNKARAKGLGAFNQSDISELIDRNIRFIEQKRKDKEQKEEIQKRKERGGLSR